MDKEDKAQDESMNREGETKSRDMSENKENRKFNFGDVADIFSSKWQEASEQKKEEKAKQKAEIKEKMDEAFGNITSMFTGKKKEVIISDILNREKIDRIYYTDDEYSNMAKSVFSKSGKNSNIEIIDQSLMQLGVPKELIQSSDYKPMIYDMVNQYLYEDNVNGEAIFSRNLDGCEQVLRTLNKNLVIRDNYIAGMTQLDSNGKEYDSAEKLTELFLDDNGIVNETIIQQYNYTNLNRRFPDYICDDYEKLTNKNYEDNYIKIIKECNNYSDIKESFIACDLNEQGKREVLAHEEIYGSRYDFAKQGFKNLSINDSRAEMNYEGSTSLEAGNRVYQDALQEKNKRRGEVSQSNANEKQISKNDTQQKKTGILSMFMNSYDSFNITGMDLNSVIGIIKDSLNKDRGISPKEQDNQR